MTAIGPLPPLMPSVKDIQPLPTETSQSNDSSQGLFGISLSGIETWAQSEIFNALILLLFVIVFSILLYALVSDQNPVEIAQTAGNSLQNSGKSVVENTKNAAELAAALG